MSDSLPPLEAQDGAASAQRHGTGHALAGFLPVMLWGLRENFTLKKLVVRVGLAVGVGLLGSLIITLAKPRRGRDPDGYHTLWELLDEQMLLLILPLIALLLVGPMFSREMRQRTLVYHLVRPVSRTTVFLSRFFAGAIPAALLAIIAFWSLLHFSALGIDRSVWSGTAITAFMGVLVLGAVYYVLSAIFRRGLIAGLVYTFVIEVLIGNLPGTIQKLSIRYHLRSLHHGLTDDAFVEHSRRVARQVELTAQGGSGLNIRIPFEEPATAAITLFVITAALLAFGCYRTATRDFALKD